MDLQSLQEVIRIFSTHLYLNNFDLGHDGAIKVWELNQLCPLQTLERLHGSSGDVWSIKHHKIYKNLVATGGSDAVLNILYNLQ